MDLLFSRLKEARESKKLSISDIARATNINPDFIKAIEEGHTNILPQTYVRAFIREYSAMVGLDPEQVMWEYDAPKTTTHPPTTQPERGDLSRPPAPIDHPADTTLLKNKISEKRTTIAILSVLLVVVTIVYWNLSKPRPEPSNSLEGFQALVVDPSDQKRKVDDSSRNGPDSLILSVKTSDTVWVRIIVDSNTPLDYLLRPNAQRSWKAKERFSVSVGNAAAIEFALNNNSMGRLGRRGEVVRDSLITQNTLLKLESKD